MNYFKHPTAEVDDKAQVGEGTKIWHNAHVREHAKIGKNCTIGRNVYIDEGVVIGNNCKIQNNVSIYKGVTIGSGVFVGPHVCFTNDKLPRAINTEGEQKTSQDWTIGETKIDDGVSIGANATIVCGVTIGPYAMIGAGSVVTRSLPEFTLSFGNPAREQGTVDKAGKIVEEEK